MTRPHRTVMNYVGGELKISSSDNLLDVKNPATGEVLAKVPVSTSQEVDEAVKKAYQAFLGWREVPAPQRCKFLFKLADILERHKEDLSAVITRENGKTLKEAKGEMERVIDNVEVACGIPTLMQGRVLSHISPGIDERAERVPLGVFVVNPPFNFPVMIPFWFFPYALACGNACIIKPSERVPLTMEMVLPYVWQALTECGLPREVISLINGDKAVTQELIRHPLVSGICSVGSSSVAKIVYAGAAGYGKRVLSGGGAKNFIVVMPDADIAKAVPNIIESVFGMAGQRCLAGSNVVIVGEDTARKFAPVLIEAARNIVVGDGSQSGATMGPLISEDSRNRVVSYIEKGVREGAELLLDGRELAVPDRGYFIGPTIFDNVEPKMAVACDEIFGPVMTIIHATDLDQAIEMVNSSRYGNSAVIYTDSLSAFYKFEHEVDCGMVTANVGVAAPMAFFPFGGRKDSFFGVIHGQSQEVINFFTDWKIIIERPWSK